jgi:hypothetical protein
MYMYRNTCRQLRNRNRRQKQRVQWATQIWRPDPLQTSPCGTHTHTHTHTRSLLEDAPNPLKDAPNICVRTVLGACKVEPRRYRRRRNLAHRWQHAYYYYYYTQGEIARVFQLCCKCKQLANCLIIQEGALRYLSNLLNRYKNRFTSDTRLGLMTNSNHSGGRPPLSIQSSGKVRKIWHNNKQINYIHLHNE